jgi:nitric oxide reductase NorQ protein
VSQTNRKYNHSAKAKPNVTSYINRVIFDKYDTDILVDAAKAKQNVLILGPRGLGKTTLAECAADILGQRLVTVPCHTGARAENLIGQWVPNQQGAGYVWMDGLITQAVRNGHVLFLDEVNSLKPEVAFAIHGLLDHRRELVLTDKPGADGGPEVIQAHDKFFFIAAGNPFYEGVRVMNEAFRDRFAIQMVFNYVAEVDMKVLAEHPITREMPDDMQIAVQVFAEKIRAACKKNAIHSDISTRALLDLISNLKVHTFSVARTMFVGRFDDSNEITAARAVFREVWDDRGKVLPTVLENASKANIKPAPKGGRFKGSSPTADTESAAATV